MALSTLSYGAVTLSVVHVNSITETEVLSSDGAAYVCTKWTFDVDCIYNRGDVGMAYTNPAGTPIVTAGTLPPTTHVAIEKYLNTNRRTLVYTVEGVNVLTSPAATFTCDAQNGPKVEQCTVKEVAGGATWRVHFRVSTWVNGCTAATNPLKSHRWRVVVDIDSEQMSTRTVIGEAIFDVGMLAKAGTFADQYRGSLAHPVPARFYRHHVHVDAADDGTTVSYQVVDKERYRSYGKAWPATRIEAVESSSASSNGFLSGAVVMNLASTLVAGGAAYGTRSAHAAGMAGVSLGQTIGSLVPIFTRSINVRAFAPPAGGKSKDNMLDLCLGIAYGRLGSPKSWASISLLVAHDPLGQYAEVNYQVQKDVGAMIQGFFSAQSTIANNVRDALIETPDKGGQAGDQIILLDAEGNPVNKPHGLSNRNETTNVEFPNSRGMRGTWVQKIVTQVLLSDNCTTPSSPPAMTANQDLP